MIKVNPRPSCSIHTFNLTSFIMTKLNAKKFALRIYFERGRSCLPPPFSHTNMLYSFVLVVVICLCSCYGILKCPTLPPHVPVNVTDLRPGVCPCSNDYSMLITSFVEYQSGDCNG